MGHVYSLIGKCDYILIPRVVGYGDKNVVCVKFNALYDIVKNTFEQVNLLDYNIDARNRCYEKNGFINMGRVLKKGYFETLAAYKKAKHAQECYEKKINTLQDEILESNDKLKILVISHPYNVYDKLIGSPIINFIEKLGGISVFADRTDREQCIIKSETYSKSLYWIYNKELIGAIKLLEDKIDGIILMTAFPCGPDSLVNELIIRKIKKIPTINIILDELQGEAGLQTRIESFMDIVQERRQAYVQ
jgi:predicted nucleotide-binding protein (sugar kinase/HSP70/actin superfamily)